MKNYLIMSALFVVAACGEFDGTDAPAEGNRLLTAALAPPGQSGYAQQAVALQLAAVSIDGGIRELVKGYTMIRNAKYGNV